MFRLLNRRLMDDVHRAWGYGSVRFLALGGTCQTAVVTCPAQVAQHVPEFVWQFMSCFSLFCIVAAGYCRVTVSKDGDSNVQHTDAPDAGR